MFNYNPLLIMFILLLFSVIIFFVLIHCSISNFENNEIKTLKSIQEQSIENEEFMKEYTKYKDKDKDKTEIPLTWNLNNTIETMKLNPCLADDPNSGRMTCYSAPLWWFPMDKYDPNNFRSVYYGDYYNPIYNYLGNAQEMFWDFKTVRDTYNVI